MWLYERPIAHRGLHNETLTENSMGAFRNAVEHGYNIEIDVHQLKSGEIAIFHDYTLSRVCKKDVALCELTLDDIKGDDYLLPNGEHIPLLTEFIDMVDGKVGIILEVKFAGFSMELEKAVYNIIKGKESYIAVQCFSPTTMRWFREHAPEFQQGFLCTKPLLRLWSPLLKKIKPDYLACNVKCAESSYAKKKAEKNNYKFVIWTVRTKEQIDLCVKAGVNNIIFEKVNLDEVGFKMTDLKN